MTDSVRPTKITSIVPPVSNARLYIETNVFKRNKPELPWVESRQRWWLRIRFQIDLNLVMFEHILQGSMMRFIEFQGAHYLEHPDLPDWAEFAEAYARAQDSLARLKRWFKNNLSCPFRGVLLEGLAELFETGTGREGVTVGIMQPPTTADIEVIREVFEGESGQISSIIPASDRDINEALFYLGSKDSGWPDLYKASEIIAECAGGLDSIVRRGWCARKDWKRFTRTANHQEAIGRFSRHARSKEQPPPDPMTVAEAERFLIDVIGHWIKSTSHAF